jgi:hypothetical protein
MRRLLLALPFALLPLAIAQAASHDHDHDHEHAEHGSLGAHEHGVAQLNAVLEGTTLELELESPAMNLVGFEHAATSAADKAKVAAVRSSLQQPLALFGLDAGNCKVAKQELESPLFEDGEHAHDEHEHEEHEHKEHAHEHADGESHSDIHAHYQFDCQRPDALQQLNLGGLFKQFPGTEKIQVQLIAPSGQQGVELTPAKATLAF